MSAIATGLLGSGHSERLAGSFAVNEAQGLIDQYGLTDTFENELLIYDTVRLVPYDVGFCAGFWTPQLGEYPCTEGAAVQKNTFQLQSIPIAEIFDVRELGRVLHKPGTAS